MNTKLVKIVMLILIIFYICNCFFYISYAEETGDPWKSTLDTLDKSKDSTKASEKVKKVVSTILVGVKIVGITVAIVILLVLAMKYMTAAPGEKAELKKSMVPYLIGVIIIFGAVSILQLIDSLSKAITPNS